MEFDGVHRGNTHCSSSVKYIFSILYFNVKKSLFVVYIVADKNNTSQVRVVDMDDRETVVSQPFALDGTHLSFRFLPRLILMSNISSIVSKTICVLHLRIDLCIYILFRLFSFDSYFG